MADFREELYIERTGLTTFTFCHSKTDLTKEDPNDKDWGENVDFEEILSQVYEFEKIPEDTVKVLNSILDNGKIHLVSEY